MADVDIDVDINTDDAINDVRRLNSTIDAFDNRIKRADDTTRRFERRMGGSFRQALQDVRVLLGAIGIGVFVRELVSVNAAFEQVRTTLVAASNSMDIVASDFSFVRSEAMRVGMPIKQVGGEFAKLAAATRGTQLEGGPAREIFSSLAEAFVATGQGADEFRLAVLAVNQMVSKGRVQAEELRGQLGERLPGAYQAAARAAKAAGITINGTTQELSKALEMGQVTAEKLLPALSEELRAVFGDAFKVAQSSPRFIMGQFQVAVESLLYTLSNRGFMVEFLGLLKDITNHLSDGEGARGAERLGSALGFMMGAVRSAAMSIVKNIDSIVATVAGLGSGAAILGIRALVGWLGRLAAAAGLTTLLATPWGWLALAIGSAVALVAKYGDALVTIGGQTARLGDVFKATFQVGSEAIRNELLPALDKMITNTPILGSIYEALKGAAMAFNFVFKQTGNLTESLKASMSNFVSLLRNGLGEENWAALMAVFNGIKHAVEVITPYVTAFFNGLWTGLQVAAIFAQEFGKALWNVLVDLYKSAEGIVVSLGSLFMDLGRLIGDVFSGFNAESTLTNVINATALVLDIVLGLALSVIDVIEVAIKGVVGLFKLLMPTLRPIANAIGAVLNEILDQIFKMLNIDLGKANIFEKLAYAAKIAGVAIVGMIAGVAGTIDLLSRIIGDVLEAIFSAVGSIYQAVVAVTDSMSQIFSTFDKEANRATASVAEGSINSAQSSSEAMIKFGDIAIGVFLSIIDAVAGLIRILMSLAGTIAQVSARFTKFFDGAASGFAAVLTRDVDGIREAAKTMREAIETPIDNNPIEVTASVVASFADNFNVLSSAVETASNTASGLLNAFSDIKDNFGHISGATSATLDRAMGPDSELALQSERNGAAVASAFFDGYADKIANRASELTQHATEQQRLLDEAQKQAAMQAAQAYADREAGIDRTIPTEIDNGGKGKKGKGGRTPGERAKDKISELAVEIMMNNQLVTGLEAEQLTREQLASTIKATEALRRAGYDMTYKEALAAGGLARQLAAMAYEAEMSEIKLDRARKAAEAIANISIENTGLESQIKAAENLTVNRREYGFQLEATKELQQANIQMTYEEALAAGGLAEKLAKVAYQRAVLKDQLSSAERVAEAIEGYKNQASTMEMYAHAAANGATNTIFLDAAVSAQTEVLRANGKTLWEGYDALTANEKALYDSAYAQSVMTASGKNFVSLGKEIAGAFNEIYDPLQNNRQAIMDWSAITATSLTAMYNGIQEKTPQLVAAYQNLMDQINEVTRVGMMRNSNELGDRFTAWIIDSQAGIEDWAGNITNIFDNTFKGMTDLMTDFLMKGKADWKSFALSVIAEITRMMVKWMAFQALKMAGRFLGLPIPFADGGIMSSAGSMPLKTYSKGGVANSPQLALFGEGRTPEAYVPLPDGRTIPVTLTGFEPAPTQNIFNTHVAFDPSQMLQQMMATDAVFEPRISRMSDADTRRSDYVYSEAPRSTGDVYINTEVSYQGGGGGGGNQNPSEYDQKMMQHMSKELSTMIRTTVIEVMRDETRPGGHFNRLGRRDEF